MKNLLYQVFTALFLLALLSSPAQAVGGFSFSACLAEGGVTYEPPTVATLSSAGSVDAGIAAAGAIDQTLVATDQGVSAAQMISSASSWAEPDAQVSSVREVTRSPHRRHQTGSG